MLLLMASVCAMVAHPLNIITNKVEFNFKIISELNSVRHMTEKVSRCI